MGHVGSLLHNDEYRARPEPVLLTLGPASYLEIEGKGAPRGPGVEAAARLLLALGKRVHAMKSAAGADFAPPFLEARYWPRAGRGSHQGRWQLLLRMPESVRQGDVRAARLALRGDRARAADVRLVRFVEGACLQALFSRGARDPPQALIEAARARMLDPAGPRHEIYLGRAAGLGAATELIVRLPVTAPAGPLPGLGPRRGWRRIRGRGRSGSSRRSDRAP